MGLNYNDKWPTQTNAPDANNDYGTAKDVIVAGDNTGTPFEEDFINDEWGARTAAYRAAGITPSGDVDTSAQSDLLDAHSRIHGRYYDNVATIVALSPRAGDLAETKGYYTANGVGGGNYQAWTLASYRTEIGNPTWVADEQGEAFTAANGLVWVLVPNTEGTVLSTQFGVNPKSAVDNTTALQSLRDFVASNANMEILLVEGVYEYSTSPNWAIKDLVVTAIGKVTFRNTGTGHCLVFDDPTGTTFNINWCWNNPVFVEGANSTGHGVYVRSTHHSKIAANIRGCGLNILRVEFSVLNEYNIVSSINQGPFYSTTAPAGISMSERNPGEEASANTYYNPIVEGMRGVGIFLDKALNTKVQGGTSEANAGANVECSVDSRNNTFDGIDLEVSGSGQGFIDRGRFNNWVRVFNDAAATITSTSVGSTLTGGIYDEIINTGSYATLDNIQYGANGGEVADTGTFTTIKDAYDIESASIKIPNKVQGRTEYTTTITSGAFGVPAAVPGNITKIGVLLANVKVGDLVLLTSQTQEPSTFSAPTARCNIDGQIDITFTQLSGAAASPLPSGGDFVVRVNGK